MINKKNKSVSRYSNYVLTPIVAGIISANASAAVLEEVMVTAQKRAQSVNDVGVAVTAFTAEDLSKLRIGQPVDLAAQTPNLSTKNASGNSLPIFTIRGVGLNTFVSNSNPSVAVYLDEVYQVNSAMMSFGLFDQERVEVLKGPQGTLFGRNTTGGAISFVSNKPSQEFEAYVKAGAEKFEVYNVEAAVGGALSETLSARVSINSHVQNEGMFFSRATGEKHGEADRFGWRGQFLWEPADNFSALLNLHGGREDSDQWYLTHEGMWASQDFFSPPCAEGSSGQCYDLYGYRDNDDDRFAGDQSLKPKNKTNGNGATLTMEWDVGSVSLTSITNQEDFEYDREEEFDSQPGTLMEITSEGDLEQFSQEFRFAINDWDDGSLIGGLFYSDDELNQHDLYDSIENPVPFADVQFDVAYQQKTTTKGLYVHSEWQFAEQFNLTTGVRYTDETVAYDGVTEELVREGVKADVDTDVSAEEVTGKVALDWTPDDDQLIYISYSKGYKSGGFNGALAVSNEEVGPFDGEDLNAYEIGYKATLDEGRLQFNSAVYFYDYKNLQVFDVNLLGNSFVLANAGKAEILGGEMEVTWLATDDLLLNLGVGYSESEIVEYSESLATDAEGNELPNSPRWSVNGIASYHWALTDKLGLDANIDFSWQDDVFYSVANIPVASEDSYHLINASFTLLPEGDDSWEVTLWVNNIEDKEYVTEKFESDLDGWANSTQGMPRTYGAEFTYRWH